MGMQQTSLGMGLNKDNTGGNSRINFNMNVEFTSSGKAYIGPYI
jgi:hypothetical protein